MQPDKLDQIHDLRLGALEQERALATPQAVGEHRQVDHQGGVGEHQIPQVDGDIALGAEGENKRPPAKALRTPILVSGAQEDRRVVGELDDCANLLDWAASTQP